MAIDILGERQSGQDVRTQNGNCRHPFLPLPSDSAGGRAGVCEIYWPESPLGAFCFSYWIFSFDRSDGVRGSGQHRQILARPRRARQGMCVFHFDLFGVYDISLMLPLMDPNFRFVNHSIILWSVVTRSLEWYSAHLNAASCSANYIDWAQCRHSLNNSVTNLKNSQ